VHNSIIGSVSQYDKRMSQTLFAPLQNRTLKPKKRDSTLASSGTSLNIPFVSDYPAAESRLFPWKSVRFAHSSGREWG